MRILASPTRADVARCLSDLEKLFGKKPPDEKESALFHQQGVNKNNPTLLIQLREEEDERE